MFYKFIPTIRNPTAVVSRLFQIPPAKHQTSPVVVRIAEAVSFYGKTLTDFDGIFYGGASNHVREFLRLNRMKTNTGKKIINAQKNKRKTHQSPKGLTFIQLCVPLYFNFPQLSWSFTTVKQKIQTQAFEGIKERTKRVKLPVKALACIYRRPSKLTTLLLCQWRRTALH